MLGKTTCWMHPDLLHLYTVVRKNAEAHETDKFDTSVASTSVEVSSLITLERNNYFLL